MDVNTVNWTVIAAIAIAIIVALAAAIIYSQRRRQTERLKSRFGAEYDRAIERTGSRARAEADLNAREQRVRALPITALTPPESAKFAQAWSALQARFVDNPKGVVVQADHLVYELMAKRGYPMGDFESRAADISVDHPAVVANYRAARDIALRDERGSANTEDLRKAVVHYRELFRELLEASEARPVSPIASTVPIRT